MSCVSIRAGCRRFKIRSGLADQDIITLRGTEQVVNHVAATSSGDFIPNQSYGPFNSTGSYHPFCWVDGEFRIGRCDCVGLNGGADKHVDGLDYNNQTNVEQCSLGNTDVTLQDLNTEDTNVIAVFNSWIKGLISDYGFEAIRIDTVKHVRKVSFRELG